MTDIVLKKGRDWSVRKHHPWIFSGAIESITGGAKPSSLGESKPSLLGGATTSSPQLGESVRILSADHEVLGYGAYSPASQIRVRVLSFDPKTPVDEQFIRSRVNASVARRADLFVQGDTNAVRVINAESDGLPGVVADSYDGHIICQFTSAGGEAWKATIASELLACVPNAKGVSSRQDIDVRAKEGLPVSDGLVTLVGIEPPELIAITEGSIRYFVDPRKGHKTGFYLDQREARAAVGSLAKGRTVLNCFSYTGGFGLAAAAGGATHVTQVDISGDAIALAKRNAQLTFGTDAAPQIDFVEADVFKYLRSCRDARKTFDLIVLDPPKFAESKAQVMKAARGYKDINLLAMKLLAPGGILATFSCSGAMTTDLFDKILAEAAQDAKRDFQMIARTRQANDHPVALAFPEGLYLKGVLLRSF